MEDEQTYYLCFMEWAHKVRGFQRKGFTHVFVVYKDAISWWRFDPYTWGLSHHILGVDLERNVPIELSRKLGCSVIAIKTRKNRKWQRLLNPFWMMNCVSMVKYFTGIHAFSFTSYGFYKRLKRMHDTGIFGKGITDIIYILEQPGFKQHEERLNER